MKKLIYILITLFVLIPNLVSAKTISPNDYRKTKLKEDKQLIATAKYKALDIEKKGYWSHTSNSGEDLPAIYKKFKVNYENGGEILAKGYTDKKELYKDWMNSKTHKEVMQDKDFKNYGCYYGKTVSVCHFK